MKDNMILKCHLCGNEANLRYKDHPGFQEGQKFHIFHCSSCNSAFSLPRIYDSNELYNHIYSNLKKIPGYDRYWKYAENIKSKKNPLKYLASSEANYWGIQNALLLFKVNKELAKIIEIGSGLGYLTYALTKNGYNVLGLDISKRAVEEATERFGNHFISGDVFDYAKRNQGAFDIVIMTEVVEHVNDPILFSEALIALIKPEGKILITTPNKSFYPLQTDWATENPPVHCWWFSEDSIKYICERISAKVSFINYKEYYKKHYTSTDLELLKRRIIPKAIFDKDWNVTNPFVDIQQNSLMNSIRKTLLKVYFLRNLVRKIKDFNNSNILKCDERGTVICAIIENK